MAQINQDPQKAFKIFETACDEYKFGRSCSKVGSYYFAGKVVNRDLVRITANTDQGYLGGKILGMYSTKNVYLFTYFRTKPMNIGEKDVILVLRTPHVQEHV